jgi:hypothetical protein
MHQSAEEKNDAGDYNPPSPWRKQKTEQDGPAECGAWEGQGKPPTSVGGFNANARAAGRPDRRSGRRGA